MQLPIEGFKIKIRNAISSDLHTENNYRANIKVA